MKQAGGGDFDLMNRTTGRWLSKDPIGISGGLNLYVAFANNPVNFVDPFGLCEGGDGDAYKHLAEQINKTFLKPVPLRERLKRISAAISAVYEEYQTARDSNAYMMSGGSGIPQVDAVVGGVDVVTSTIEAAIDAGGQ